MSPVHDITKNKNSYENTNVIEIGIYNTQSQSKFQVALLRTWVRIKNF